MGRTTAIIIAAAAAVVILAGVLLFMLGRGTEKDVNQLDAELTDMALATHPRLTGDDKHGPAWQVLQRAVQRDETWLLRAVELGILTRPPIVSGKPILPVSLLVPDDDARMRAAEQLARDMIDPKAVLVPIAETSEAES